MPAYESNAEGVGTSNVLSSALSLVHSGITARLSSTMNSARYSRRNMLDLKKLSSDVPRARRLKNASCCSLVFRGLSHTVQVKYCPADICSCARRTAGWDGDRGGVLTRITLPPVS